MQMCAHSAPERQIIQSSWAVAGKLLRLKKRKEKKKIQAQTAPFLQGAKLVVVKKDFQEHREGKNPHKYKKTNKKKNMFSINHQKSKVQFSSHIQRK